MGLNPKEYIRKYLGQPSAFEIRICSIRFLEFIKDHLIWENYKGSIQKYKNSKTKTYSVRLKYKLENYSHEFLLGFVRGLMDTDGFVKSNNIGCGVVSKKLIQNLEKILLKNEIITNIKVIKRPPNRRDLYLLIINKTYLNIYSEKIGFSNIRKNNELLKILVKMRPPGFEFP